MKASELVKELQERIDMWGDLEVVVWDAFDKSDTYVVGVTANITDEDDEDNNESVIEIVIE